MTISAVGDEAGAPPSVDVTVSVPAGSVMSSVELYRNDSQGRNLVRSQPAAGFDSRTVTDYECPYGEPVTYDWAVTYFNPAGFVTIWDELWASLASWTILSGTWNVSGGKARNTGTGHGQMHRPVTSGRRRVTISSMTTTAVGEFAQITISGGVQSIYFETGISQVLITSAGTTYTTLDATQPITFDFLDNGVSVSGTGGTYFLSGSFDIDDVQVGFYSVGANNVRFGEILVQSYPSAITLAEETAVPLIMEPAAGWLIHPSTPGLSFPLQLSAGLAPRAASIRSIDPVANPSNATLHRILASARAVATSNGPRDDDETGMTISIHTAAEESALKAMLLDQTAILVNISPSKGIGFAYGFYQVEDTVSVRLGQAPNQPYRSYLLPMVRVDSPAVTVQTSRFSWAQLNLTVPSWSSTKTTYGPWANVQSNTPL